MRDRHVDAVLLCSLLAVAKLARRQVSLNRLVDLHNAVFGKHDSVTHSIPIRIQTAEGALWFVFHS